MEKTLKNTNNFENYKKTRGEYYYCYSPNQYAFIVKQGILEVRKGMHRKTGKIFWVFKRTKHLSKVLDKWTNGKTNIQT